jgi:primosomal protein N' (replication factor Y)
MLLPGTRVLVTFGPRKLVGVVLGEGCESNRSVKLKPIISVMDQTPVYSQVMVELAKWLSAYYMHPIGEVFKTMLPASGTKSKVAQAHLTDQGQGERASGFTPEGRLLRKLLGVKRDSTSFVTMSRRFKKLLAEGDEDAQTTSFDDLLRLGLIKKTTRTKISGRNTDQVRRVHSDEVVKNDQDQPRTLTPSQKTAFDTIVDQGLSACDAPPPFLLMGVTGSGKTEIYLQLIAETLRRTHPSDPAGQDLLGHDPTVGCQTLVMVPEISLTPQMTHVFEQRFPGLVAVVHSAMPDHERWAQLTRIRDGSAKILIGPRSAVFGPFANLRLVIVDEEHDSSYKQSSGLVYNGRDVAVLRGRMEKAVVVLGSATPSMESLQNALSKKYTLIELPERVTGRALPQVSIIGKDELPKRKFVGTFVGKPSPDESPLDADVPMAPRILEELRANLNEGHQSIVLVNRRGYAYYLFATKEQKPVQCPHCSISLTIHSRGSVLRCHYCDYVTNLRDVMAANPNETFATFGYGSQKAEDYLIQQMKGARIMRIDSDAVIKRDALPTILRKFRNKEVDILVGTQILAKGHDFPNVTLIALIEVDQQLALPDFRAGEKTFQLIVQAAGRAGRAEHPGRVIIQCAKPDHPVVATAIKQDYKTFANHELAFRKIHDYPPFGKMIAFEWTSKDKNDLDKVSGRVEKWFEQLALISPQLLSNVKVLGPSIPAIEMLRGRHRRTLILISKDQTSIRRVAALLREQCNRLPGDVRMTIDIDPQSLI